MKRFKGTDLILMILPVLGLVLIGLWQPSSTLPVTFGGASVARIPLHERNQANPYFPDTRLSVFVNRQQPPWPRRLWVQYTVQPKPHSSYLLDSRGRKYTHLKDYGGLSYVGNVWGGSGRDNGSIHSIGRDYRFHLAQIPASAGEVTFHTTYAVKDGGVELPVSVMVRSRRTAAAQSP